MKGNKKGPLILIHKSEMLYIRKLDRRNSIKEQTFEEQKPKWQRELERARNERYYQESLTSFDKTIYAMGTKECKEILKGLVAFELRDGTGIFVGMRGRRFKKFTTKLKKRAKKQPWIDHTKMGPLDNLEVDYD